MSEKEIVQECIFKTVEEWNSDEDNSKIPKADRNASLLGENGSLDSLGIVNFIVLVEENLEKKFNKSITLANEDAMTNEKSPFETIGSLIDYSSNLLEK